ncbi:hypothetical protein [Metabacillus litoralis]|nr:hypothetical protein [Metabacillus litoralis]
MGNNIEVESVMERTETAATTGEGSSGVVKQHQQHLFQVKR